MMIYMQVQSRERFTFQQGTPVLTLDAPLYTRDQQRIDHNRKWMAYNSFHAARRQYEIHHNAGLYPVWAVTKQVYLHGDCDQETIWRSVQGLSYFHQRLLIADGYFGMVAVEAAKYYSVSYLVAGRTVRPKSATKNYERVIGDVGRYLVELADEARLVKKGQMTGQMSAQN